jgi:hypothetical protein
MPHTPPAGRSRQARAQAESSAIVAQAAQAAAIRHQQAVAAAQIQSQVRKR